MSEHDWGFVGRDGDGYALYSCPCGAKAIYRGTFDDYARMSLYVGPVRHDPESGGSES